MKDIRFKELTKLERYNTLTDFTRRYIWHGTESHRQKEKILLHRHMVWFTANIYVKRYIIFTYENADIRFVSIWKYISPFYLCCFSLSLTLKLGGDWSFELNEIQRELKFSKIKRGEGGFLKCSLRGNCWKLNFKQKIKFQNKF